jgi:hypothetical protein
VEVDDGIAEAIQEGIAAGVFRRAARLNPKFNETWSQFATEHTDRADTLLTDAMKRLGVDAPCRCSRWK